MSNQEINRYVYMELTEEQYQTQRTLLSSIDKYGMRICNVSIEQAYKDKAATQAILIDQQTKQIEKLNIAIGIDVSLGNTVCEMHAEIESLNSSLNLAVKTLEEIYETYMKYLDNELECDSAASDMDDIAENAILQIRRVET